jgi:hypothetical protein
MNKASIIRIFIISVLVLPVILCSCYASNPATITVTETEPAITLTVTTTKTVTTTPTTILSLEGMIAALPPLPVQVEIYVDTQWYIDGSTANLFHCGDPGERYQWSYVFDKPVTLWFTGIDEEIISIGGLQRFPLHQTDVVVGETIPTQYFDPQWNPPGTALYYYMENVIAFSYSIAPLNIDGSLDYYLFITPSNEGDYVNAFVRSSEW